MEAVVEEKELELAGAAPATELGTAPAPSKKASIWSMLFGDID